MPDQHVQQQRTSALAGGQQAGADGRPRGKEWNVPHRYELGRCIGNGSYGSVYQAYDRIEKRSVAVKKVKRVFEDLIDCKRILREIAILGRINDTRIVKLYDICVPSDLSNFTDIYLVLELCDSDFKKLFHLREYELQKEFLTECHTTTLLYNTLCGIKYLHSAGIYHRDIKPANCLVNTDCGVKICDFGLSRALGEDPQSIMDDEPRQSKNRTLKRQLTGHVVTRWYRAPELILLQENYNEQIDIWSLGCIFAELLGMVKENIPYPGNRGPLFQGGSCFPLSPDRKQGQDKYKSSGNRDQLNMIFNILGTPEDAAVQALEKEDTKRYVRCFKHRKPVPLREIDRFKNASPECLDLLEKMLVFEPKKRISVEAAVEHPLFKSIRKLEEETVYRDRKTYSRENCSGGGLHRHFLCISCSFALPLPPKTKVVLVTFILAALWIKIKLFPTKYRWRRKRSYWISKPNRS
ncbi:unnamed protein product [Amoebophrya sp. A120]|nr:unnamed protein product [Amoebophrya sp. A120]|eukprot:GSA120T00002039001.1